MRRFVLCALAFPVILISVAPVQAQFVPPQENRFVTYGLLTFPPGVYVPPFRGPLELRDQFGVIQIDSTERWYLGNPASIDGEPTFDPDAHQAWWRIEHPTGDVRTVYLTHRFGTEKWVVFDPRFLVLPARKNAEFPGPPPERNHYLCYEAAGPPLDPRIHAVSDQFGGSSRTEVTVPRYFCNPVDKLHLDTGELYARIDPSIHLACYGIIGGITAYYRIVTVEDQFQSISHEPSGQGVLCLPCYKDEVIGVEQSTWGKIKSLYRD